MEHCGKNLYPESSSPSMVMQALHRRASRRPHWTTHRIPDRELEAMQRRFDDVVEVDDDVLEEVRKPWKTSAVLIRSLGRVVPAEWVVKELRRVMELPEPPEIFPLLEGFFVVRFSCEEHREKALSWGPWLVAGQIHAMERWRPNFSPGAGELNKAIVWLRMLGLPLDYWEESIILQMAAKAGKPLAVDEITEQGKKRGFARVKIEVDL
ncbi:uncharacterized protein LOC120104465 [Phoenix dactylifera]|uniref:Uncharacterized protein LOC120104465 n=1 Tax=Phoenix dactylifera TaxID=42345 RepID=A0A8B8ZJE0_PHODC|nr:uncharacterized protein LOC120104465 [Phoenix dactylifera]